MKYFPAFLLPALIVLHPISGTAQSEDQTDAILRRIVHEYGQANGGTPPVLTDDPQQATVYVTLEDGGGVYAVTNYRPDPERKIYKILPVQSGRLDPAELGGLFAGAPAGIDVTRLPYLIHSKVFQFFMDTRFVDERFPNVSIVSLAGHRYPMRNGLVEVRPGCLVTPSMDDLDAFVSFLFDRGFEPANIEALSLINNKEINGALTGIFPNFEAIRTETHIEKAFQKSDKKSFCLFAHIGADGQLMRYRSSGEVSYELSAIQFLHLGAELQKEVILVGINYADDTSRTLDVANELKRLGEGFQKRNWGDVLLTLAGPDNQVQVSAPNTDGFYFKRAEVSRPEGMKPARAYSFIFFKTPPKPSVALTALRFVYGHSGKILSALVVLQLLFFFVFRGEWTKTWKWVNLVLTLIFAFVFAFSL